MRLEPWDRHLWASRSCNLHERRDHASRPCNLHERHDHASCMSVATMQPAWASRPCNLHERRDHATCTCLLESGVWVSRQLTEFRHFRATSLTSMFKIPIFYPKGFIFILEFKFQSFLAEPTHMPDLSSEEFDFTPKEGFVSIKNYFYLIHPYSNLNKIWMNTHRNAIFGENLVFTPKILGWTGHCPPWFIMVTRGQFLKYQLIVVMH